VNAEAELARALSDALGTLYRVSLIRADGSVEISFRADRGAPVPAAGIAVPGSASRLLVEVDVGALEAADRVLHDLANGSSDTSIAFPNLDRALEDLVAAGEARIGRPISSMSRLEKQRLVRFLDARGAFSLRKSVESVAAALRVSRFTVYNYLDASRDA
jgi:hypothetical protein